VHSSLTIGNFSQLEAKDVLSHMRIILPVNDFILDWRRYNLVSNYIAEYTSYHFEHKDRAENLISTIFYELIAHIASSSLKNSFLDIQFSTYEDWLIFEISSSINSEEVGQIKEILTEINKKDLDSYYLNFLEADLDQPTMQKKMGMLMIAHDYNAHLSARISDDEGSATIRALVRQKEFNT
jgi:hypothetical protein